MVPKWLRKLSYIRLLHEAFAVHHLQCIHCVGNVSVSSQWCGFLIWACLCWRWQTLTMRRNLENTGITSIAGTIPSTLSLLTNLQRFYARGNNLTGSIPTTLVQSSLYDLNLSNNKLSGSIPIFPRLVAFEAESNSLQGTIPSAMFTTFLQTLLVANTILLDIFFSFHLLHLRVCCFQITLNYLFCFPNTDNCSLIYCFRNLGSNKLTGTIPSEVGLAGSLSFLNLESNSLSGTIPTTMGKLDLLDMLVY
jgi:hypothetical protein